MIKAKLQGQRSPSVFEGEPLVALDLRAALEQAGAEVD